MFRAVLDTSVLVPGLQRDFLLQLAAERTYAPLWGTGILHELDYVLERLDAMRSVTVADSKSRRQHLFSQMKRAFPGACMNSPKDGDYSYALTDEFDGHVAHAAVIGKADAIVTNDRRAGFENSPMLISAEVEILAPHVFAANTVFAHTEGGLQALLAMAARTGSPPMDPRALLDRLATTYQMEEVAEMLAPRLGSSHQGHS
ncbi:PIN domain-containing protein [Nesterenkonia sphaerica]|uniref:PIN domain-containing protein n=1 Tax=Nesterenkonia sphaerica TaxID=1804988 RepID=A0A5R9A4V4_9MICC|nr:PIN domain-containing protein [Nesterenkonia sphaerica]TLP73085.1 PIN domain-containing protein [Nesterenkonia sphaerica]